MTHLGISLNGDKRVTAYQSCIAVLLYTFTGTIDVAIDDRGTRSACNRKTDRHHRVPFHTAYLATTIDSAFNRAVTDADSCTYIGRFFRNNTTSIVGINLTHHGLRTGERVGNTLTTTEDVTLNGHAIVICTGNTNAFVFYDIRCCQVIIFDSADVYVGVTRHIGQITTAIDVANDIGTLNSFLSVVIHFLGLHSNFCHISIGRYKFIFSIIISVIAFYVCIFNEIWINCIDFVYCTDIHRGVAIDCSFIATAEHTTFVLNILLICISSTYCTQFVGSSQLGYGMSSRNHIDIHRWVSIHISSLTKSTTVHLTDAGAGDDVQFRISIWRECTVSSYWFDSPCPIVPILCICIYW